MTCTNVALGCFGADFSDLAAVALREKTEALSNPRQGFLGTA